ncbi:hypothetical protein B566_EDAN015718 [Ephemera danica]|nr:hypothetical protein B566_EDAN015718 [Ephemera danica]
MKIETSAILLVLSIFSTNVRANYDEPDLYKVEGRVYPPDANVDIRNWQVETRVMVNGGEFVGFLNFSLSNLPSGSYVVEIVNPDYYYEPARVEINTKGKFRARKVNFVQTSLVMQMPYPLRMKSLHKLKYFQAREQWRATDLLFSPMVLMMVLPLLLIMVLPKMMSDPETRQEMEQLNTMGKYNMPEMSEVLTSFFSGGSSSQQRGQRAVASRKKRQ